MIIWLITAIICRSILGQSSLDSLFELPGTGTGTGTGHEHDAKCPTPGQFYCGDIDDECVSESWVCDGEVDCPSGLDERQNCCSEGKEFECHSNGLCIESKYRCDSFADCDDFSDEKNCTLCAEKDLFHCVSDRCVDPVFVCDKDNDCGDFSDEIGCGGQPEMFECQSGAKSVHESQLCDRVNDCGDMSDEIGCAPCDAFHFHCHDNQGCVLVFDLCDGVSQCGDSSDEYWCDTCRAEDEFKCRNGRCVPANRACNLIDDCGDMSDEDHCSCDPELEFECKHGVRDYFNSSNVKCVPDDWVCDGMADCNQGTDEEPALCEHLIGTSIVEPEGAKKPECLPDQFECMSGYCIPNSMVCDGIPQCDQEEDEISCPVRCPRGKHELCLSSEECLSYEQFCDGHQDCSDNSDESFSNGYCVCSGVLCGGKCVTIDKICDSNWDCLHGEDEKDCTRCRPNLHNTRNLIDQTIYVINLIKTTYGELDNFQIYFSSLVNQWSTMFGDENSPFHLDSEFGTFESEQVVKKTQEFLLSLVAVRPILRQFMSVMVELGFTKTNLPRYETSETLQDLHQKRYVIERTASTDLHHDLILRSEYLKMKAMDAAQVLSAITKTLHYDFSSCQDTKYLLTPLGSGFSKRSMREVFTALTLVQGEVSREEINEFLDKLYQLDQELTQLVVSVQNLDHIIVTLAFVIDHAREQWNLEILEENPEIISEVGLELEPPKEHTKPSSLKKIQQLKQIRTLKMKRLRYNIH